MVGFHQPDHAAAPVAAEGLLDVVLVVGYEVRAVGLVGRGGAHGDVVVAAEPDFERGVYFGAVVVPAELGEAGFRTGLEA